MRQHCWCLCCRSIAAEPSKRTSTITFASFTWPKKLEAASATARDTFKKKAMESVKSSASEALSMFPVLRSFCSELPTKNAMILPALKSFYALCTVLELLKVVNECNVTSDSLRNAIQAHLNLFQECYGPDLLPKGASEPAPASPDHMP